MGRLQAIEQGKFGGVDSRSNPITLPPDRFLLLRNWRPRPDGHLELRDGYTIQPAGAGMSGGTGPIHSMSPYTVAYHGPLATGAGPDGLPFPNASECVFFWRDKVPFVRWLDGDTCPTANPSIRGNPIASAARWQYALGKDGYPYMHNGTDMKFFDGVYLRDIGLPILTQALIGAISVAEDLSSPTTEDADNVTFTFETPVSGPPSQANAISGLMYMAYFDKSNDVLATCPEPLSGAAFPSGHTAPAGYDAAMLGVNNLPVPTKAGAVTLLYYPGSSAEPTLQPGTVCNFYPRTTVSNYGPQFEYSHAGDTYGGGQPLPGSPLATFALNDNEGLMFNPGDGQAFPEWTGNTAGHITPMVVAGVTSGGSWDGSPSRVIWSGAVGVTSGPGGFCMTVWGSISIPAAGDYDFIFVHDDGALIGFGDSAVPLSGFIDPAFQTLTADKGYPVACSRMSPKGLNNDSLTVTFPAAGIYHFEIDYVNWETAQTCCLFNGDGTVIVPSQPTAASTSAPSFLTESYGIDDAVLSMVSPSQVNVALTAHGLDTGDIIVLSLHKSTFVASPPVDYTTPFAPVEWSSNGPFTITKVDDDNFTFNTPEAALYDGATPITVLALIQIDASNAALYIVDTDDSGWPFRASNGLDTNQSGGILLPSPLDPSLVSNLIPASAIGGAQPGYQFYASIYNPLTGHVGNRVPIGKRIVNETPATFVISGLPDLSTPFAALKQMLRWGNGSERLARPMVGKRQGQIVGLASTPGDSEWCLLIGRTGDGGEVPYAIIDSAGNWVYSQPGQTSVVIDYSEVDGNSELPTENYIPPPFIAFWREGDRLCGAIDKQPFVYRSGSELDATTGIFVGDPAQAWNPAKVETFPTAKAIRGGFGFMQESWVFTDGHMGQLSELSGEVGWNGPYNFGIIGRYAFDHGWNSLPFWISKDKQLCTMLPDSNGPISISTEYEATMLARIGNIATDPTAKNNHNIANGLSSPQFTFIAPGNPTTLALFVTNADGGTTPTGWSPLGGGRSYKQLLSSTNLISLTHPSTGTGAPGNEWANVIATIKTDGGTPAEVQHLSDNSTTYSRSLVMADTVAGNCIIVSFSGNGFNNAGTPSVTDTQGNTYVVIDSNNSNSGYHVEAFLAIAIGIKAGPNTVTIGTTLNQGNCDLLEYSGITPGLQSFPDYSAETELVYFRDPLRLIDALRIKCRDQNGDPFVVIHDFNLRDADTPFGQGYEEVYESTLASDFTSIRVFDDAGHYSMWAGGADARFYQFYLGGNDNDVDFTADAISLRYVSGERTALKTLEWYGDGTIQWFTNDSLAAIDDPTGWVDFSDQMLAFPGDEGNSHYQTDMNQPEVLHLFLWAQLVSHPGDAPDPENPMAFSVPPHMPLETYGRLYLVAPLIGDTRGR